MFNKAETSSLSIRDKQKLKNIIVNKITPIEDRANKLKTKLKEKRDKKARKSKARTVNFQSPQHPNGKCGNKLAFPHKQAAWVRPHHPPPQYHRIPPQPPTYTKQAACHRLKPCHSPPQHHYIPPQPHMFTTPPPTPHVTETPPTPPHGTHPSTSTSSSVKQAPTTNVSKASPTTGISTGFNCN